MILNNCIYLTNSRTVVYNYNKYLIVGTDNVTSSLDLSRLEYLLKKEIKRVIQRIAEKKGLTNTEKENLE